MSYYFWLGREAERPLRNVVQPSVTNNIVINAPSGGDAPMIARLLRADIQSRTRYNRA